MATTSPKNLPEIKVTHNRQPKKVSALYVESKIVEPQANVIFVLGSDLAENGMGIIHIPYIGKMPNRFVRWVLRFFHMEWKTIDSE